MSLIKFNRNRFPWNTFGHLDTDNFFSDDFFVEEASWPAMNVKEHKANFEIELAAPGFNKKDFQITLKDRNLEVSAENSAEQVDTEKDYTRKEFSYSSFKRAMHLPDAVDDSKEVKATYKNGILTLELQKKEETKENPKKIIAVN
ncbi:Hsp20/alpha crystallin family protein [Spongiimicrobium sp. 3-5]|uniref:Hsp20/alpha crystallin family protein n=1 Tax=Spongiimicrobium sp. 3-5 TaxID=3332596 RepID=UPI00397FF062